MIDSVPFAMKSDKFLIGGEFAPGMTISRNSARTTFESDVQWKQWTPLVRLLFLRVVVLSIFNIFLLNLKTSIIVVAA